MEVTVTHQKENCPSCQRPFRIYTRYHRVMKKRPLSIDYEKRYGEKEECGNCYLKNRKIEVVEGDGRELTILAEQTQRITPPLPKFKEGVMHHYETTTNPRELRPQVIPSLWDDLSLKIQASRMIENINHRLLSKGWDYDQIYQFWSDEIERGEEQMINS